MWQMKMYSLSLSQCSAEKTSAHARTHAHTHAFTHARTHARTSLLLDCCNSCSQETGEEILPGQGGTGVGEPKLNVQSFNSYILLCTCVGPLPSFASCNSGHNTIHTYKHTQWISDNPVKIPTRVLAGTQY